MRDKNRKHHIFVFRLFTLLLSIFLSFGSEASAVINKKPKSLRVNKDYGRFPLFFVPNAGQLDPKVKFYEKGIGHHTFFTRTAVILQLFRSKSPGRESRLIRLVPLGANPNPEIIAEEPQAGRINFFRGNNPRKWIRNLPAYKSVRYREMYPGVDVRFYGNGRQLEYDIIVKAGADPSRVAFSCVGAENLLLDEQGNLKIRLKDNVIIQKAPHIYQVIDGKKVEVAGRFQIKKFNDGFPKSPVFGFELDSYNTRYPLVIDPVLVYSTYLGGSGADYGYDIAVDDKGNVYICGVTRSIDFPMVSSLQESHAGIGTGDRDVFVAKIDPGGTKLLYSTYLGGSSEDLAYALDVDRSGNAYITGYTWSGNFPIVSAVQPEYARKRDAFVVKIDPSGSGLSYSTYLGGGELDGGHDIAVDSFGNAYITGETGSRDFPVSSPFQAKYGGGKKDAFLVKINSSGTSFFYSGYLGGSGRDRAWSVAVDKAGNAYVSGDTDSIDFPLAAPFQRRKGGGVDAFVTKLDSSSLSYSTYLGGKEDDYGRSVAVDSLGNAYVSGGTKSSDFPLSSPIQKVIGGGEDAFVTKIETSGSRLSYSTYLGGGADDRGEGLDVDYAGNAYVTGYTASGDFPSFFMKEYGGGKSDAFVTKIAASGTSFSYSTFLGGKGFDRGNGLDVDSEGNAYIIGWTRSENFPTLDAFQENLAGEDDAFIVKIETRLHVYADGHGDYKSIQEAIEAASNGDTVVVHAGVYRENIDFKGKGVVVRTDEGATIDGSSGGSVVTFKSGEGPGSVLDGFTLINGSGTIDEESKANGGGIYCYSSSPVIINCVIRKNNAADYGGGIYCREKSPTIINSIIQRNKAGSGGGIYCRTASPSIINCLISDNLALDQGGGMWLDKSSPLIVSCTLTGNRAGKNDSLIACFYPSSKPFIINSILWGNGPNNGIGLHKKAEPLHISHSNIQGGYPGTGNLDLDPLFVNPLQGNYHLQAASPCVDSGIKYTVANLRLPDIDIDGDRRPQAGGYDMGADEVCMIQVPGDFDTIQQAIEAASDGCTILVQKGTYRENIDFKGKAVILRARKGAVIDGSFGGSVVTFKSGEGPASVLDGFTIMNGRGTVIGSETYGGGIYCNSASPRIINCVIKGNSASYRGGGVFASSPITLTNCTVKGNSVSAKKAEGGGIFISSPSARIINCQINRNSSTHDGGGIYSLSSLTIEGSKIQGNQAGKNGAGIYFQSGSPQLTNCLITGNAVSDSKGLGGGIYCHNASPVIVNCTLSGNYAAGAGGGIAADYSSTPSLAGSIVWGNTKIDIKSKTVLDISYSNIEGGYKGRNNLSLDPRFSDPRSPSQAPTTKGDYHLRSDSPCIDAAAGISAPPVDIEGDERPQARGVDIGSDEYMVCTDADKDNFYKEGDCGTALDCDDKNPQINPGAVWYKDADGDGYSDGTVSAGVGSSLALLWNQGYDGGNADIAYGLAVDKNDHTIVVGFTSNGSNSDWLIRKYNTEGRLLWNQVYNGGSGDMAYAVATDGRDRIIVTGRTYNGNNWDWLIQKYSPSGNLVWSRIFNGGDEDKAAGVAVDRGNNIIAVGYTRKDDTGDDWLIQKYNPGGEVLWTRTFDGGRGNDAALDVAVDHKDNIIVLGKSLHGASYDWLIRKYDRKGNLLWSEIYSGGVWHSADRVIVDNNGRIIVTGSTHNGKNIDLMVKKHDPAGFLLWTRVHDGGSGADAGYGASVDSRGNIIIAGYTFNGNSYDLLIKKFDSGGLPLRSQIYDGRIYDHAYGIAVDSSDNMLVAGQTDSGENPDWLLLKYGAGTPCARPAKHFLASELTSESGDCDDNEKNIHPGVPETCNKLDDNCDGQVDEGCNTDPAVTINTPNGGENWSEVRNISWMASDIEQTGNLDLSAGLYYGSSPIGPWTRIAGKQYCTGKIQAAYSWDTASLPNGTYWARVVVTDGAGGSGEDVSDGSFTLDNGTRYFVNSKCGSDGWAGLSRNCNSAGGPRATIGAAVETARVGETIVVAGGVYPELVNFNGKSIANLTFTVGKMVGNPSVKLKAPGGGETWSGIRKIAWTATDLQQTGVGALAGLYYASNPIGPWMLIVNERTCSNGVRAEFAWDTTAVLNGTYYVRAVVSDGVGGVGVDTSHAPFTVSNLYNGPGFATITDVSLSPINKIATAGDTVTAKVDATDPDSTILQYKFMVSGPETAGKWKVWNGQDWTAMSEARWGGANYWKIDTSGWAAGNYRVYVYVSDENRKYRYVWGHPWGATDALADCGSFMLFEEVGNGPAYAAVEKVRMTPDSRTAEVGGKVTFRVEADDPDSIILYYKFMITGPQTGGGWLTRDGNNWVTTADLNWSTSNNWKIDTTGWGPGKYRVFVLVSDENRKYRYNWGVPWGSADTFFDCGTFILKGY